jgi:2-polyprenyl-3-methyl-5-hydroxy-6-metoxy-1,4-benzoquinol methylase
MRFLGKRRLQPELMDQPNMSGARHRRALRGLQRINAWSGSARILWRPLADLARSNPIRVLDVATGAGDVPVRLWHKANQHGLQLEIHGCDRSASALEYARQHALARKADVRFFQWDVYQGGLPDGYDVLISSLFLHHLSDDEAVHFLRNMAEAAGRLILVNDLRRSLGGWVLALAGTRLLSRSPVVHTDGARSVGGAFTTDEAAQLARRAGLPGCVITRRWPYRFLLTWWRS